MDFLDKFESNKRYVFDKEIYIEYMLSIGAGYSGNEMAEELWTTECNNQLVKPIADRRATITIREATYDIIPGWCREVSAIRLLTESDL